jgi:hypothetical protein
MTIKHIRIPSKVATQVTKKCDQHLGVLGRPESIKVSRNRELVSNLAETRRQCPKTKKLRFDSGKTN